MQGIATCRQLDRATRGGWSHTTLAQVMRPLSDLTIFEPNQAIFDVLGHMDKANFEESTEESTVVENGIILGFITYFNAK